LLAIASPMTAWTCLPLSKRSLACRCSAELIGLQRDQTLSRKADHLAQEAGVRTLLQKLAKGDLVIGHRGGGSWISSRPAFLLPARVLGKLFCRLFLTRLIALYDAGRLAFFGGLAPLADRRAFLRHLSPVGSKRWAVYAKPPFAGPEAVLAYLSRYTHRVAISNRRRGCHVSGDSRGS
jgi:hypothetical protein